MAAPYNPPVKGEDFITYVSVISVAAPSRHQTNPTIATGDFKVAKDGGTLTDLDTLPVVTPTSSKLIKITLSATEMTADNVTVVCSDQTNPPEWADLTFDIVTTSA
jgi:hypothetical protein